MITILVVMLLVILLAGGVYRYPAWGATGAGYPDLVGLLLVVLLVVLVVFALRGAL